MAYIVAEPCIKCKYTDCVEVCPVNCFHEGPNFMVIHPTGCIDCGACEPVCPARAIFPEAELPSKYEEYKAINAEYAEKWPNITQKKEPLPEADEFKRKKGKRGMLEVSA